MGITVLERKTLPCSIASGSAAVHNVTLNGSVSVGDI